MEIKIQPAWCKKLDRLSNCLSYQYILIKPLSCQFFQILHKKPAIIIHAYKIQLQRIISVKILTKIVVDIKCVLENGLEVEYEYIFNTILKESGFIYLLFTNYITRTHTHSSIIKERLVDDQNQAFQSMTVVKSVITLVD